MKNLKINKKLGALLVACGIGLCKGAVADITSYNQETILSDGNIARVYFTTTIGDTNYAYVSFGNNVGYVNLRHVDVSKLSANNDYQEIYDNLTVTVDNAYLYQTPNIDNSKIVNQFGKNSVVSVVAKSNNGWYIVYNNGVTGFMHENCFKDDVNKITVAKVIKNNINVRSGASTNSDIIGFADVSDTFTILDKENNWYKVDYLGNTGYIRSDLVKEVEMDKNDLNIRKIGYLTSDSSFYYDDMNKEVTLPAYQNVSVIEEGNVYDKVMVDGVIGYINKGSIKRLSSTCTVVDLSRQILRIYKNNKEVYRCHIITGRESLQTQIGCFKIGHKVRDYQLTQENRVYFWIQYDGNRGFHDAGWQKDKYFKEVAVKAYDNYASGYGKTYPYKHGSHGCSNMQYVDVVAMYNIVNVGDNVLVIGPNCLIRSHVIAKVDNQDISYDVLFIEPECLQREYIGMVDDVIYNYVEEEKVKKLV